MSPAQIIVTLKKLCLRAKRSPTLGGTMCLAMQEPWDVVAQRVADCPMDPLRLVCTQQPEANRNIFDFFSRVSDRER